MDNIVNMGQNDVMSNFTKTDDIMNDMRKIIEGSQKTAHQAVNTILVQRNWLIGYRIASEELNGEDRADYGAEVIKKLSFELTKEFGKGYTKSNLYSFYSFYKTYPEMLQTQNRNRVENEMKQLTADFQTDKLEFIKNPVIAEFLGLSSNTDFTESELESSILSNIQKFLMELGKGYAFVARQQHIKTEKQDYYIDLVFYNYILKCFVLIDLKTEKITHQDVGQMDMYIRMYDELKRSEGDNPTIGIVLCSDTDEDIARYSVMHGNEQLFASKYKLYLPTEEELRAEIETQKAMYYLQHDKDENNQS